MAYSQLTVGIIVFIFLPTGSTRYVLYRIVNELLVLTIMLAVIALQQLFAPDWPWVPLYGKRTSACLKTTANRLRAILGGVSIKTSTPA